MNTVRIIFFFLQRLVSPVLILHTRETEQMTECKEGAAFIREAGLTLRG